MLIELGNHDAVQPGHDDRPKVTSIFIQEADCTGAGGYSHEPGLKAQEVREHLMESLLERDRITNLPEHEILVSLLHPTDGAWQSHGRGKPAWVKVTAHEDLHGPVQPDDHPVGENGERLVLAPHAPNIAEDLENTLREFWRLDDKAVKPADIEGRYWTRWGAPGVGEPPPQLPDAKMLYLNTGRVVSNVNDGGGQTGLTGTGTAATATTLTTNLTLTTNAWAGYRVYVMQTATGPLIWGNVLSNTNAAGASVLTVDRWYSAATPGGAAPTAPSAGFYFMLADGGVVSTWFIGLNAAAGTFTPLVTDTGLAAEYTTAGGGWLRKIAPYAQTSGVATRQITLTPVFTMNGSDTLPTTVNGIIASASMVPTGTSSCNKFSSPLNANATGAASGDQLTVTETVNGS